MQTLAFWILLLIFVGAFAAQVARRVQLIAAAPNTFSLDDLGFRAGRFLLDVVLQRQTIRERPLTGLMHAFVFWGFVAFGGYTTVEFLYGLGIVDLTGARWFHAYRIALTPFAVAVLAASSTCSSAARSSGRSPSAQSCRSSRSSSRSSSRR